MDTARMRSLVSNTAGDSPSTSTHSDHPSASTAVVTGASTSPLSARKKSGRGPGKKDAKEKATRYLRLNQSRDWVIFNYATRRSDRVIPQHNPPPPICRLPAELLLLITETLKTADLRRLLRVCRTMRPIAEVHLYHHLSIPLVNMRRIAQLLRTLRDRPDLAGVVLSFTGYLIPHLRAPNLSRRGVGRVAWFVRRLRREKFVKEQMISNFASLLDEVLKIMKNLSKLSMYDLELGMPPESIGILSNVAQR
ncbi:hypothetical protein FRB94_010202, partial [Tulasnella sp. JGI-2019a]